MHFGKQNVLIINEDSCKKKFLSKVLPCAPWLLLLLIVKCDERNELKVEFVINMEADLKDLENSQFSYVKNKNIC